MPLPTDMCGPQAMPHMRDMFATATDCMIHRARELINQASDVADAHKELRRIMDRLMRLSKAKGVTAAPECTSEDILRDALHRMYGTSTADDTYEALVKCAYSSLRYPGDPAPTRLLTVEGLECTSMEEEEGRHHKPPPPLCVAMEPTEWDSSMAQDVMAMAQNVAWHHAELMVALARFAGLSGKDAFQYATMDAADMVYGVACDMGLSEVANEVAGYIVQASNAHSERL